MQRPPSIPAPAAATASTSTGGAGRMSWMCDVCKVAHFDSYDEALAHENQCEEAMQGGAATLGAFVNRGRDTEEILFEISSRLRVMIEQESSHYHVPDYLSPEWQRQLKEITESYEAADGNATAANQGQPQAQAATADDEPSSSGTGTASTQIIEMWREKICEWCYQFVDHFDFSREIVSVAMSYLDRYLSISTHTVNRRIFQLVATAALYLAIKLYEPGKFHVSSLIDVSHGYFTAKHIATMEESILQSLGWRVHPPTPYAFVRDLVALVPPEVAPRVRHDVGELARFMTELSACDYWFATRKPSSVALGAVLNALKLRDGEPFDPRVRVDFLHSCVEMGLDIATDSEIIDCYERLREMYIAGGYSDVQPVGDSGGRGVDARGATRAAVVVDGSDAVHSGTQATRVVTPS